MAKKQKKPTGLIIATSVLAVLFTLSAVAIGLFVGFNSDTVLAAIKNKETSFALTSELENVTAEKDKEIENVTAEKNAELALAELDKEQARIDAEAEKAEAIEAAIKQTLLDRHALGISNVNDLIGVEMNADTWSAVNEITNYEPIIENKNYKEIFFKLQSDENSEEEFSGTTDTFVQFTLGLNLEDGEEYTLLETSSGNKVYIKAFDQTEKFAVWTYGLFFNDDDVVGFINSEEGYYVGAPEFPTNYFDAGLCQDDDPWSWGFGYYIRDRFTYVAPGQNEVGGWGEFLSCDERYFYTVENATPQCYYYVQPLELPGVHVAFDEVERLADLEADTGLNVTLTVLINGEEIQYTGVVGLTEWGAFVFMIEYDYRQICIQSDLLMYDWENEIGIYAEEQIGGATLLICSETAIDSFVIESIVIGDEVINMGD